MRARAHSPCHFSATPLSHEVIRRAPERELHRRGAQPFASASKYFRRPPASLEAGIPFECGTARYFSFLSIASERWRGHLVQRERLWRWPV